MTRAEMKKIKGGITCSYTLEYKASNEKGSYTAIEEWDNLSCSGTQAQCLKSMAELCTIYMITGGSSTLGCRSNCS